MTFRRSSARGRRGRSPKEQPTTPSDPTRVRLWGQPRWRRLRSSVPWSRSVDRWSDQDDQRTAAALHDDVGRGKECSACRGNVGATFSSALDWSAGLAW